MSDPETQHFQTATRNKYTIYDKYKICSKYNKFLAKYEHKTKKNFTGKSNFIKILTQHNLIEETQKQTVVRWLQSGHDSHNSKHDLDKLKQEVIRAKRLGKIDSFKIRPPKHGWESFEKLYAFYQEQLKAGQPVSVEILRQAYETQIHDFVGSKVISNFLKYYNIDLKFSNVSFVADINDATDYLSEVSSINLDEEEIPWIHGGGESEVDNFDDSFSSKKSTKSGSPKSASTKNSSSKAGGSKTAYTFTEKYTWAKKFKEASREDPNLTLYKFCNQPELDGQKLPPRATLARWLEIIDTTKSLEDHAKTVNLDSQKDTNFVKERHDGLEKKLYDWYLEQNLHQLTLKEVKEKYDELSGYKHTGYHTLTRSVKGFATRWLLENPIFDFIYDAKSMEDSKPDRLKNVKAATGGHTKPKKRKRASVPVLSDDSEEDEFFVKNSKLTQPEEPIVIEKVRDRSGKIDVDLISENLNRQIEDMNLKQDGYLLKFEDFLRQDLLAAMVPIQLRYLKRLGDDSVEKIESLKNTEYCEINLLQSLRLGS